METLQTLRTTVPTLKNHEIIAYSVIATFLYFVFAAIYHVTLHPLAGYPGPFLAKISQWPLVVQCYRGNRHIHLLHDHEKYGPVVRNGPNSLSFNTATALQAIHADRNANVKRGDWYKTLDISSGAYSTQSVIDKAEHAFRRRVLSQAFSERALKDAETIIGDNVSSFCDGLGALAPDAKPGDWTEGKNMNDWSTWFGFDFISNLSFGKSLGLCETEENRYVPNVLKGASRFLYYAGYLPFAALIRPVLGTPVMDYIAGQAGADSLRFTQLANSNLAERVEAEKKAQSSGKETRKDVFHYLLQSRDPVTGKGFSREELQADSGLLIAAGSDGIAFTISAALFYLLRNPAVLAKLTKEIRSAFQDVSEIHSPKINSLTYLQTCVDETLRISPALPSMLPREVLAGGIDIDGRHIPKGTTVGVPAYAIHHNEIYYPSSWEFRPERWIVDEKTGVTPESVSAARRAFCPFSAGPMNCVGKNMAYLALKLALATLLYRYDIRPAGELTGGGGVDLEEGRRRVQEYQIIDYLVAYRDGPMVQLRSTA